MTSYKVNKKKDLDRYETPETRLADRYTHHTVDISYWATISQEQLDRKKVKRFLRDYGKANSNTVVSNDGNRAVQRTPTAGKKPDQGKRAERSTTPNAKRKL